MRLTLLGTGTHIPDPHRAGPAVLIEHDLTYYLVDCGRGVTRQLVAAHVPPERVNTLLFTHHHFDHNSDYGDFVLSSWVLGRRQPLTVYGPPGTQRITDALLDLHAWDIDLRLRHERLDPNGVRIDCHEIECPPRPQSIEIKLVLQRPGLTVYATAVDHGPAAPAFAYRFDTADRSIVISGDTRPCDALVELARDCDVLVHEVMDRKGMEALKALQPHRTRSINAQMNMHTGAEDLGLLAARASVKTLVLTHFHPAHFREDALTLALSAAFSGEIVLGRDLITV